MSVIDIFSRIELPKEEVFKYLSNSSTISRCSSPFFNLKNLRCKSQTIDLDTHFTQECVFSELLQLFFNVKEIIPNKKITYQFEGLIKGSQNISLIEDEKSCILKESIEFYLFNQFSLSVIDLFLSVFFYLDTFIKHLRLKSILYKDNPGIKNQSILKDFSTIRSYIEIDADTNSIMSLFDDLHKLSLWISPFIKVDIRKNHKEIKEGEVFSVSFIVPFLSALNCIVEKKEDKKIKILFTNSLLKGNNTWTILPDEKKFLIENSIEIEEIMTFLKLGWFVLGNTLLKSELNDWNKRLKEIVEKTNLRKHLDLAYGKA